MFQTLFSKFGTIVDLRILSKSGGMKGGTTNNKVPNYGFIIFDSVTTVQSVLSARVSFNLFNYISCNHLANYQELMVNTIDFNIISKENFYNCLFRSSSLS